MFLLRFPGIPDLGSGMADWAGCGWGGGGNAAAGVAEAAGPLLPGGGLLKMFISFFSLRH